MITNKTWIYNRMRNLLASKNYDVPIHTIRFEYNTPMPNLHSKITDIYLEVHQIGYHDKLINSGFTYIKDGYFSKIYSFPIGLLN